MRHALRHRPDHIVVGEVRGAEAADLLQALNTGHGGSLATVHANNATAALSRLASCAMQASDALPFSVVCRGVVDGIEAVDSTKRDRRRAWRKVSQMVRVRDYDAAANRWIVEDVWPVATGAKRKRVKATGAKRRAAKASDTQQTAATASETDVPLPLAGVSVNTTGRKGGTDDGILSLKT